MYSLEQMQSEQFLIDHGWVSMQMTNTNAQVIFLCPVKEWDNVPSGTLLATIWGARFCKSSFGNSKNISYAISNGYYEFGITSDFKVSEKKHRSIDEPFEPSMKHNHNNDNKTIVFRRWTSC